ncbi:hypothetical protein [Arthrobacter sp. JSM 101049]|uniref:hypothetical protein n=1 Tax=Arthrobacter sp. JSM 101049 TaxID=929097 RepID=UPI00356B131C
MATPERRAARRAENLDILIGFLGFFAAVLVVVIVTTELQGGSALLWSPVLLVLVLAIWGLWRLRSRLPEPKIERKTY